MHCVAIQWHESELPLPVLDDPVLLAIDILTLKAIADHQDTVVKLRAAALLLKVNTCRWTQGKLEHITLLELTLAEEERENTDVDRNLEWQFSIAHLDNGTH